MSNAYLVDVETRGNVVKFWFTDTKEKLAKAWGDDWNDAPACCNAGGVYDEYKTWFKCYYFDFSCKVMNPLDINCYVSNEYFSYADIKARKLPRLVVDFGNREEYFVASANKNNLCFYFGDTSEEIEKEILSKNCGGQFLDFS